MSHAPSDAPTLRRTAARDGITPSRGDAASRDGCTTHLRDRCALGSICDLPLAAVRARGDVLDNDPSEVNCARYLADAPDPDARWVGHEDTAE